MRELELLLLRQVGVAADADEQPDSLRLTWSPTGRGADLDAVLGPLPRPPRVLLGIPLAEIVPGLPQPTGHIAPAKDRLGQQSLKLVASERGGALARELLRPHLLERPLGDNRQQGLRSQPAGSDPDAETRRARHADHRLGRDLVVRPEPVRKEQGLLTRGVDIEQVQVTRLLGDGLDVHVLADDVRPVLPVHCNADHPGRGLVHRFRGRALVRGWVWVEGERWQPGRQRQPETDGPIQQAPRSHRMLLSKGLSGCSEC